MIRDNVNNNNGTSLEKETCCISRRRNVKSIKSYSVLQLLSNIFSKIFSIVGVFKRKITISARRYCF